MYDSAVIRLRKIYNSDIIEIAVSDDDLKIVDISTGFTHSITNVGLTDLNALFWADEIFNPELPDIYYNEA